MQKIHKIFLKLHYIVIDLLQYSIITFLKNETNIRINLLARHDVKISYVDCCSKPDPKYPKNILKSSVIFPKHYYVCQISSYMYFIYYFFFGVEFTLTLGKKTSLKTSFLHFPNIPNNPNRVWG